VIIWDEGTVEILREEPSHLSFALGGRSSPDALAHGKALNRSSNLRQS
jgi:hypothetical protein